MVCQKCESKLTKVAAPEVKRGVKPSGAAPAAGPERRLNENKLLGAANKAKYGGGGSSSSQGATTGKALPYGRASCRVCKGGVSQVQGNYCNACAYKNGICAICGRKILDTRMYKQSVT